MLHSKWTLSILGITLTVALALAVDWAAGELVGIGSSDARWLLLTVTLLLVAASLTVLWAGERSLRRQATQDIELLGRSGSHPVPPDLRTDSTSRAQYDWLRAFDRLKQRLSTLTRRLEEADRERHAHEHRAKNFESKSRQVHSVLSALGEPVLVIDKRDQLVLTNSSADRLLAINPSATEERALDSLVQCEQLVNLLTETRKRNQFTQTSCEIELCDQHGENHWYRVTARNIPTQAGDSDVDGTSQGAVALLHDISSQRVLQKRNADFVTAVSHEMKTPLAGIKAYVELLTDGDAEDAKSRQEFLQIIAVEADRLQYLVDDLVDLARIEADLPGEQKRNQPLVPVLVDAVGITRALAAAKSIHIETKWPSEPLDADFDRTLMVTAAEHLLTNAIKYTPTGGSITCRAWKEAEWVIFEVSDTGVGIPKEDLQRVFEKFYRRPETKHVADGSGLGLPMVKHIVEGVHGGRVEVESTVGTGTLFRVRLPLNDTSSTRSHT